jgi:signal transduction histidine kinase
MAAVGQIAAGIAHEVGNPLSSISSIVQMLKRAGDGAPTAERLDLIQTHIRRISMTVRQLVTLARPVACRWEQIDLGPILEEAVRLIVFDRRARTVEIDFPSAHSLPLTYGMPDQLQQVFINLLLNALDSMPEGGKLTIRSQNRRRHIAVRIQDTGCGVAPEVGRRIFEPFFSTKPPGEGTGLGLAVSYGIVQKHGGDIDFVSTPGEGTAFTVLIPIIDRVPDDSDEPNHHTPR